MNPLGELIEMTIQQTIVKGDTTECLWIYKD